jgi:hypothetical protein
MKAFFISMLISFSAVFVAASCDKHSDRPDEPLAQAAAPAAGLPVPAAQPATPIADLLTDLNEQVKAAIFDNRSAIANAYDPVDRHIGDAVNLWKSQGGQYTDEASRGLDDARTNAVQSFKALGDATAETWTSAKDNAVSALQRVQSSLNDLKDSEKPKP